MSIAFIRGYNNRYSLSDLWGQAFGDDPEFIADMYATGYIKPEDVFALTEDSRLLAAVFTPEYKIRINGEDHPIRLLSCVATDRSQRGKGYMSFLISRVLTILKDECAGVCVIPVSDDLFDFYKQFGFKTAFFCSETLIEVPESESGSVTTNESNDLSGCYQSYLRKYAQNGFVYKTEERFRQAVEEYRHVTQASGFFRIKDGFAFYQKGVSELLVREYADINLAHLARKYSLPVRVQDPFKSGTKKAMAMLVAFSEELSDYSKENDLYLNCMYN